MANGRGWILPTGLAAVLTVLNAAKPVVVDDTAYLFTARHIASHPADPYGFDLFWYDRPMPAWQVLLPPVVPYWLGLGIRLFSENLVVLKLWLFPFALILSLSLASLLRRFARGYDRPMLTMTVLGPAVLPFFNFMLDVPALALGLCAVAVFVQERSWSRAILAGVLAGLAMQTKYTMLTLPAVIGWFGLTHRRYAQAGVALLVATVVFGGWENWIAGKYGESHFLYHLREQGEGATREAENNSLWAKLTTIGNEKFRLLQPMLGYLGWLGVGVWLTAAAALGVSRRVLVGCMVLAAVGLTAVCVMPARYSVLVPGKLTFPTAVFVTLGSATSLTVLTAAFHLLIRFRSTNPVRRSPDSWFLAGWLALELGGYFAMTPFPAGRRVMAVAIVGGLLAARLASRISRTHGFPRMPRWVPAYGVTAGVGLFALDLWEALAEKVVAERAAVACEPRTHATWYNGHWGFEYYCDRAGMKPVVPGQTELKADDFLVFPAIPDDAGFYRPYHGGAKFLPDPEFVAPVQEIVWDDCLAAQTIPNLYGGEVPVTERAHPRLRVVVYRVVRDWRPEPAP